MKKPITPFNGVSLAEFGGHAKATWVAQFHQAHGRLLQLPEHAALLVQYNPETVTDDAENLFELLGKDADPKAAALTYVETPHAAVAKPARLVPGYRYG